MARFDPLKELQERCFGFEVQAVGPQMDAGEDDLLIPRYLQAPERGEDSGRWNAAAPAPGERNDAVAAPGIAPVLYLQKCPGVAAKAARL